jgi:hypothetical protein
MAVTEAEEIVEAGALVAVIAVGWVWAARAGALRWLREHQAARRSAEGELAAVAASLESEAFGPEVTRQAVVRILGGVEWIWRNDGLLGGEDQREASVIARWAAAHDRGPGTRLSGPPRVDLLRVVNRGDETEDRVYARVRGAVRLAHAQVLLAPHTFGFDERWTLVRRRDDWRLVDFDTHPLSRESLDRPQIVAGWDDEGRLREQSLAELAEVDGAPSRPGAGDLVDRDADPYRQLLDLSVVDGHFAPALIQGVLEHLVEAWEEATLGSQQPLSNLTTPHARSVLLHPDPDQRSTLVLRDARLKGWKPVRIASDARVDVELVVSCVRRLVGRDGGDPIAGSTEVRHEIQLSWTLEATNQRTRPWRLADTSNPAQEIPGVPWQ